MPAFPLIDAHVHLYDPGQVPYRWLRALPPLDRAHLPADYRAATLGIDVEALVFVEVNADPGAADIETDFIETLAEQEPRIQAIVGALPLHDSRSMVAAIRQFAARPLARGVRTLIEPHAHESGWALHDGFVDNVRALAQHDLSFDLCLQHTQLADVIALVRRCPEVRFVLDHIAKPGIREGLIQPWHDQLRQLARFDNVCCKLSGVVTEAEHRHWTDEDIAPYIAHAIDCFGYGRILYGSDWPVSTLACKYSRWVAVLDDIVADATEAEQRQLYRDNAIRCYRLQ